MLVKRSRQRYDNSLASFSCYSCEPGTAKPNLIFVIVVVDVIVTIDVIVVAQLVAADHVIHSHAQ